MSDISSFPCEIVTEIEMSRSNNKWLVLEGSSDEKIFLARPLSSLACTVVAKGWENVVKIVESCDCFDKKTVVGLIDRDYRDLDSSQPSHENVVVTDYRDIENILFESSALVRVYTEFGSQSKLPKTNEGRVDQDEIRKVISLSAYGLGKFRAYCHASGVSVSFDEMDHEKFINDKTLQIDSGAFVAHLNGKPDNRGFDIAALWRDAGANSIPEVFSSPVFVRHGHDLMAMVSISLRRKWGSRGGSIDRGMVESLFRLAIDTEELNSFEFWKKINNKFSPS